MKLSPSKPCPCGSTRSYGDCCGPIHRHVRAPETAEALMRSRYSAFALGNVEWLTETLASTHEDRTLDPRALAASIRDVCRAGRFMGLAILAAEENGDRAHVTFHVRVFSGGRDRSFDETSEFVREDGGWRYLGAFSEGAEQRRAPGLASTRRSPYARRR